MEEPKVTPMKTSDLIALIVAFLFALWLYLFAIPTITKPHEHPKPTQKTR